MSVRLITGDCRDVLPTLEADSFDCVVTSPPYWGQRDYGMTGQIGRETTLSEHVAGLVLVFREVRRILKPAGVCWVNYGDAWATKGYAAHAFSGDDAHPANWSSERRGQDVISTVGEGVKEKDMIGGPWRLAFALRDDGWWLRDCIIWHKPNPPPTSVKDRTCPAHEYVFMFTRSARYAYDHKAIEEPAAESSLQRYGQKTLSTQEGGFKQEVYRSGISGARARSRKPADVIKSLAMSGGEMRKRRSVWTIPVHGFSDVHFATFPPDLVEPCIKAGCPIGGSVLDPFGGAGTVGLVADRLGRNATLIELNPGYRDMASGRVTNDAPLFAEISA